MCKLCIQSDFKDFYDGLSADDSSTIYRRFVNECMQRGSALKYIRSIGIRTIEIKQVSKFFRGDGDIVVYTDPKGHNGTGKEIMTVDNAIQSYGNCIASRYYNDCELYIKYLQVGKKRYNICYKIDKDNPLSLGTIIDVKELNDEYNRRIGLPIFSIDYISDGQCMIATDFNEVENLEYIGMSKYLDAEYVKNEIIEALAIYNKL